MASSTSAPASSVTFPISELASKPIQPVQHLRPPHLPFRRISLPTAPTLLHRDSVVSVASFDSLPEDEVPQSPSSPLRSGSSAKASKGRPISMESPRKKHRRRDGSVRPSDDAREAKRRKVIEEFYETERAYVDGLELIYTLFLTPIITSLETSQPLLDRSTLTSVFSNFIDIWNLHRSFFSSLTTLLSPHGSSRPSSSSSSETPSLSPILLAHFPYLSLYNPFVTAFPSTISSLTDLITPPTAARQNPRYSPAFASFLKYQEADPCCGKLKLRDWLLTIVQRCPRYLLLLKDLINCTDQEDPEHSQLRAVHTLVSKITLTLNTSLHTHAQTLSLLSLQRSTPNLPFQLIVPGRTLLKRGSLFQVERSESPREREFLLFSDCLIWLASEDAERSWSIPWALGSDPQASEPHSHPDPASPLKRPGLVRSRSKSEAELSSLLQNRNVDPSTGSTPSTPKKPQRRSYHHPTPSPSNMVKRQANASGGEERWVYKGRAELVDLEVIVTSTIEEGEERRFEVLSPEGSFVLYAGTEDERDEWASAIRQAKSQLLVSLNVTNPNSTLTSSASTNHVRRSLQALPFPPSDERIATIRGNPASSSKKSKASRKPASDLKARERRGKVEHWVPAIWIPDEKTDGCMRCGKSFGWRRRRHHCRLCGRCVCASCSGRTFFITDPNSKEDSTKPARACDACYETVFPLINSPPSPTSEIRSSVDRSHASDTITSLAHFPSWHPVPSHSVQKQPQPQALMAIDVSRESSFDDDAYAGHGDVERDKPGRVRLKSLKSMQRPRSYHQILQDFEGHERSQDEFRANELESTAEEQEQEEEMEEMMEEEDVGEQIWRESSSTPTPRKRREDTARRVKRFSLPAVALQTTSVTAHTSTVDTGGEGVADPSAGFGAGKARRFSLVLAGRNSSHHGDGGSGAMKAQTDVRVREVESRKDEDDRKRGSGLGKGVAAGRLSELLGRKVKD